MDMSRTDFLVSSIAAGPNEIEKWLVIAAAALAATVGTVAKASDLVETAERSRAIIWC